MPQKTITVSEIVHDMAKNRVVIKDEKGLSYSFFTKSVPTGAKTEIFSDFEKQELKENSVISLEYVEKQSTFKGKEVTFRNVVRFLEGEIEETEEVHPFPTTKPVENKAPDWDKIRDEKTQNIKWMNALNNATAITCAVIGKLDVQDVRKDVEELANWLYNLQPK